MGGHGPPRAINRLLAVGLNPAWQLTLVFPSLHPNRVNRATASFSGASGKAVNFARAARIWGAAARVAQLAGGDTGQKLCRDLDEAGLEHVTVWAAPATRTCITCLDSAAGTMTELIEPAGKVSDRAVRRLRRRLLAELPACAGVAWCGTVPPGVPPKFAAEIVAAAMAHGRPVLLDAVQTPALAAGATILKVNRAELSQLAGPGGIPAQARRCLARHPRLQAVAITDGPRQAWLVTRQPPAGWRFLLPPLPSVVSPLGAGDTVAAVFFVERLAGTPWPEAFARGLAAGSASCLTRLPAQFTPTAARAIRRKIRILLAPAPAR